MYIQIKKNVDGSHTIQHGGKLCEGWAAVPAEMKIPNTFPYVNIETALVTHPAVIRKKVEEVNGEKVEIDVVVWPEFSQIEVVKMTEGEKIELEKPEPEPTAQDDTDAMLIDHEYRLTMLELGIV